MLSETVIQQLETRGYRGGVVSIEHLPQLREEIEAHHRQGLLDETFYEERLTGFPFSLPESLPQARSLIVVGVHDPHVRFTFTWHGRRIPLTVPPTYLHWRDADEDMAHALQEIMAPTGHRVAAATVPKKLLAVHSGLAAYGRNNITYMDGMGSFFRLAAFASDLPCERDDWQELRMLERCQTCRACLRSCPTGAISGERFLLHAERCITFLNEKPTSVEEGAEFSPEETGLLLEGVPLEQLPAAVVSKLEQWDLIDLLDILPRNMKVLIQRAER
jgi:epoxyqueuosine reductase